MKTVILTGANGFIGTHFLKECKVLYRVLPIKARYDDTIDLPQADVILHCAGLAHQTDKRDSKEYFEANTILTQQLFKEAKRKGIKHFIYLSSIKTFGPYQGKPFQISSACNPQNDPYGESKLAAEKYLLEQEQKEITITIIRPPLVYGPGVKANMLALLKLADTNIPIPIAKLENKRTLVFVKNLVDLLKTIIEKKASGIFLAGDTKLLSTEFIIKEMRAKLGRKNRNFYLSERTLKLLRLFFPEKYEKLFGDLIMDTSETNKLLQFQQNYSSIEGIEEMVNWYKNKDRTIEKTH